MIVISFQHLRFGSSHHCSPERSFGGEPLSGPSELGRALSYFKAEHLEVGEGPPVFLRRSKACWQTERSGPHPMEPSADTPTSSAANDLLVESLREQPTRADGWAEWVLLWPWRVETGPVQPQTPVLDREAAPQWPNAFTPEHTCQANPTLSHASVGVPHVG